MVQFKATIKRFDNQGEKTGWTYIDVPVAIAEKINPGVKKEYRVKGKMDAFDFRMKAIMPVGGGNFILPLNAEMRKGIRKQKGATVHVNMEIDTDEIKPPEELIECLEDEPEALKYFNSLTRGHQNYFTNWINSAKTDPTKTKRLAATLDALNKKWGFGQMIRAMKKFNNQE